VKVFISHSCQDEVLARRVADGLRKRGLDVWDDRDVFPGDNWARKLSKALEQAQAMVVLITPDALRSDWVRREIEYALGKEKFSGRLIPVVVGPLENIPKDEIPWILWRLNVINLTNPEKEQDAVEQIAKALRKAPEKGPTRKRSEGPHRRPRKGSAIPAVGVRR